MNDYFHTERWLAFKSNYSKLKKTSYTSLFFGDSMTENFTQNIPKADSIVNMGINGDFSEGLLKRMDAVINFQPDNIFIMIGINDIVEKVPLSEIEDNYFKIIKLIKTNCPNTKIFIESTLPTCGLASLLNSSKSINKKVQKLNEFLAKTCHENELVFVDMYSDFADENNELKRDLTSDGIHLSRKGNLIWVSHVWDYIK
jgi:lysophospholipase L1-like esterase